MGRLNLALAITLFVTLISCEKDESVSLNHQIFMSKNWELNSISTENQVSVYSEYSEFEDFQRFDDNKKILNFEFNNIDHNTLSAFNEDLNYSRDFNYSIDDDFLILEDDFSNPVFKFRIQHLSNAIMILILEYTLSDNYLLNSEYHYSSY